MFCQHFSNISNHKKKKPSGPYTNLILNASLESVKNLSWALSTEDYIPSWQKTNIPQMHLNVFPLVLHSSGMTNTSTV